MRHPIPALALAAALSAVAALAAAPHPFTVHDLVGMDRISDPQVSPDGRQVAFVVRTPDLEANTGRFDLWRVGIDGSGPERLTTHLASDTQPRWAPDGSSLFFLSTRSGLSQVWRLPMQGGEARRVTDLPLAVNAFALSPDGRLLALAVDVFPDCKDLQCTMDRLAERLEAPASGLLFDHLFVRHWDSWSAGRRSHLLVVPVAGGTPVDVTAGMESDVPSKPFGGPEELTFTTDGRELVFSAHEPEGDEAWSTDFDLYRVPVDGSAPPSSLTADNPAWDTQPAFSPDGKTLAYLAMRRPGYESDRFRIVLRDWATGSTRVLTEEWDRSPASIVWSRDGRALYATAPDQGEVALFVVDAKSGAVQRRAGGGHVEGVQPAPGGMVVFGRDSYTAPVDLYAVGPAGDEGQITHFNADRLAEVEVGEPETFTFAGWNGETVRGWVVKPVGLDPSQKVPVAFLIHGGPHGSFGPEFHYRWNPQPYAGAGYAAVMIDFHGSEGYGQAFADSIRGDWGGKPLVDLRKGLAAALERYPWLDGDRVCALGASYGGFMINWIEGRWPDRFRCLVNHDGTFDQRMMYYTTEELWFPEWEDLGAPWENPEGYARQNPALAVGSWETPMLVIHGAHDFRLPMTQGLAAFTALQRRGIESRFLYFPDENHWVLKPHNSIQWHDEVLGWLDRWLKGDR